MRGADALIAISGYLLSAFHWQDNAPIEPQLEVSGLQLGHVVHADRGVFNVREELRDVIALETRHKMRGRVQRVPRFRHAISPGFANGEVVVEGWRASIEGADARRKPENWDINDVVVPDITDKDTVVTLAKIAANAYVPTPHEGDWSDVNQTKTGDWRHNGSGYGWDDDGVRGYVFTTPDRKSMVLSIKGTSAAVVDDGGPTAPQDKINDNLFYSCCCARISYMWNTVCDCFLGNNQCDQSCIEKELWREDRYYRAVLDVFADAIEVAPDAEIIWITGHSLGGGLSSMLGRTYGIPVVTFETPGDDLPVRRLHLPVPPGLPPWEDFVWHFGHNTDPIFKGTCRGGSSTCWLSGFAMETSCHSGKVCSYDTKGDLGWHDSIVNHRIHAVIDNVLEVYDEPAECVTPDWCEDCVDWEFIDPYDVPEQPSSSSSSTKTTKSSATTSSKTTSTSDSTSMTTSCVSRAWYGRCEVWTTVTGSQTETQSPTQVAPTRSRSTPRTTSTPHKVTRTTKPGKHTKSFTSSCYKRGWYGQCKSWTKTPVPPPTGTDPACKHRNFLGQCDDF